MLAQGTVIGDHRLEGVLGAGAMGVVYEATQLSLGRRVALKALRPELAADPQFVERFRREGRSQAAFSHPHAIEVFEALEAPEGLFLAMRLERGPTLAQLLAEGRLDAATAVRLLHQVAEALDAAHAAGLVHRDVKPHNVLVGEDGDAHLGDFGLARSSDGTEATVAAGLGGTVAYLAPEVALGGPATPASDRWSLAATAFQCLTGTVVFPRPTAAAVLLAVASEPAPAVSAVRPQLPPTLDHVFAAALARSPAERPARAVSFVTAVEQALGGPGLAALGPPPPPTPAGAVVAHRAPRGRGRGRARTAAALGAAALAGGVLGAVLATGEGGPSGPAVDVPPPVRADARPLGSDLAAAARGRTVDCRGRRPSPDAPACSIAQVALPGGRLVVPADGVVLGWAVAGARGELALQVLRKRSGGTASQVGRSQYEVVNTTAPQRFDANIAVEQGDVIALEVTRGAAVGVAPRRGATTERWFPTRRGKPPLPADAGPGTGLDGEVLVRADYVPGAERRVPALLSGAEAARAPDGEEVARRTLRFTDGTAVVLALVEVDGGGVLDLLRRGRRVSRIGVPGYRPGARLISLSTLNYEDNEAAGEAGVEWVNENSARVQEHYYGVYPRQLEFFD